MSRMELLLCAVLAAAVCAENEFTLCIFSDAYEVVLLGSFYFCVAARRASQKLLAA